MELSKESLETIKQILIDEINRLDTFPDAWSHPKVGPLLSDTLDALTEVRRALK